MNSKKRAALILAVVTVSSLGSPALAAKDGAVKTAKNILGKLCTVSGLFGLPSTACDLEKAMDSAIKVADSVKSTIDSLRKQTVPQALQSALQPITGENAAKTDAVQQTISETLDQDDIGLLTKGIGEINQQLDGLFSDKASALSAILSAGKSSSPTASSAANASAGQISGNEATQGLALSGLAKQGTLAKQIVGTTANGVSSQRIAQALSDNASDTKILETAQDARKQSVARAQTAVSSRAALQVIGEQLGFMMEQSASQHLHLLQFLASEAQNSSLSTQQLTTMANLELQREQSKSAGATEDFKQLVTEAQDYPSYVEETFKGWGKTLTAAGDSSAAPALGSTTP
jgi:hypothetical protein